MSVFRIAIVTAAAILPPSLRAQQAQPYEPSANSQVERVLHKLQTLDSYEFRATAFVPKRAGAEAPTNAAWTCGARERDLTWWQHDDDVLAQRGDVWLTKHGDAWTPCRHPTESWQSRFLADPTFLATRLLAVLDGSKWEFAGAVESDGKPLRLYRVELGKDAANGLVRSGALTTRATPGGAGNIAVQQIFFAGGLGAPAKMPDPDRRFRIEIHEDPTTKLPVRILAHLYGDDRMVGGVNLRAVRIVQGQQQDEEEEEEGDGKKEKAPNLTIDLRLDRPGTPKDSPLDQAARTLLSPAADQGK